MTYAEKVQRESIFWFASAGELHLAAKLLWDAYDSPDSRITIYSNNMGLHLKSAMPRTFTMNAGLSIELALKACIIQRFKKLSKEQYTHNLLFLKNEAGLILDKNQQDKVTILTEFISWAGRYPQGKKDTAYDELVQKLKTLNIDNPSALDSTPITWEEYHCIWQKILYHYVGIGGSGTVTIDGRWIPEFKEGPVWKVIKETQNHDSISLQDFKMDLTVAEAFILAEKLNDERIAKNNVFEDRYYTQEMSQNE
jgi:hypothetical protein